MTTPPNPPQQPQVVINTGVPAARHGFAIPIRARWLVLTGAALGATGMAVVGWLGQQASALVGATPPPKPPPGKDYSVVMPLGPAQHQSHPDAGWKLTVLNDGAIDVEKSETDPQQQKQVFVAELEPAPTDGIAVGTKGLPASGSRHRKAVAVSPVWHGAERCDLVSNEFTIDWSKDAGPLVTGVESPDLTNPEVRAQFQPILDYVNKSSGQAAGVGICLSLPS